uniref:Hypothetical chloroplast RF53 n=1 Tax=Gastroclonium compressum TaxID=1852973 RepID=A0A173FZU0_GASCM|nr:hypothetical chloroplast RF53 [Coeloseira compressa]ANH09538.1 hypothetical chloroplast RF53 [Coeloseira compressa]
MILFMNTENTSDLRSAILSKIEALLRANSLNQQLDLIDNIMTEGIFGQEALLNFLIKRLKIDKLEPSHIDGLLFQVLNKTNFNIIKKRLNFNFNSGIVEFSSELTLDYSDLQKLLIAQNFQQADKITQSYLCTLASLELQDSKKRNWLYFTDIIKIPLSDLYTIDTLWRVYSGGKFGFSVQKRIWYSCNSNWEKLWYKIGWKKAGVACRYPSEFIWTLNAPDGHLPLFNQLRGVQSLNALFNRIINF